MRMATVGAGEYKLNSSIDHIIMSQDATGQLQCEWMVSGCGRRTEFRSRAMWSEATATMMAQRTTLLPPRCVLSWEFWLLSSARYGQWQRLLHHAWRNATSSRQTVDTHSLLNRNVSMMRRVCNWPVFDLVGV